MWKRMHLVVLTHWGRVTDICVSKLTIIGSDNGLSPGRRQAIIWTNAGILLIEPLGTNFSEILIGIQIFSFKKMRLKMPSAKWRPFCLGLNVLNDTQVSRFISTPSNPILYNDFTFSIHSYKSRFEIRSINIKLRVICKCYIAKGETLCKSLMNKETIMDQWLNLVV